MRRRQIPTAFALSMLLALVATAGALAKDDAIVTFDAALPADPEPGTEITIGWTVETPGEKGEMAPFNAEAMFVRLIPATGDPVEVVGRQGPPGHYTATVTVPDGGIVDVEAGLRGESCAGGTCQRSDILFTIDESTTPASAPRAATNVTTPASPASADLQPLDILGVALAAMAIVAALVVSRGRDRARARAFNSGTSRS